MVFDSYFISCSKPSNNGELKNNVGNISYQCPSCGANMAYDPVKSALYCSYCETTVNVDQIKSTEEYDLSAGLQEDATWDSGKIIFLEWLFENVEKSEKILDVGIGSGVYGKLLKAFY